MGTFGGLAYLHPPDSTPGKLARHKILRNRILGMIMSNIRSRVKMTPGCPIFWLHICHRWQGKRNRVTDEKVRSENTREQLVECVDVRPICYIVKGDFTCFIVQKNPNAVRPFQVEERYRWGGKDHVLISFQQPHGPDSVLRRGCGLPLSQHRLSTDTYTPLCSFSYHDLPVMPSWGEVLQTQDTGPCIKSLRVVGEIPPQLSVLHTAQISSQEEARMRCDRVQLDINCGKNFVGHMKRQKRQVKTQETTILWIIVHNTPHFSLSLLTPRESEINILPCRWLTIFFITHLCIPQLPLHDSELIIASIKT